MRGFLGITMSSFGNIFDLDNYTDAAKSVVSEVGDVASSVLDAGHTIGNILKGISPALAFVPGIGTALAVGIYAAGAITAADPITDALIGTASAAMPPGLPRIAFDGATNVAKDVARGNNAFDSCVEACRQTTATAGPQAQAAFDAALNMARGGAVDPRLIAEAKASFANGGTTASMAFDAGIGIAKGQGADQIALDVARGYVRDQGGPLAAAAFDTGIALGYGQTLQQAGWAGLHTLVRGNNPVEMILEFIRQIGLSNAAGIALPQLLQNECVRDAMNAIKGAAPQLPDFSTVKDKLEPIVKAFQNNLPALDIPSGNLAQQWGLDEALVRAAQSLVDRATGQVDNAFLNMFDMSDTPGNKERNDALEAKGKALAAAQTIVGLKASRAQFNHTPAWLRGFYIALATCAGYTQFGPGQQAIRDSIPTQEQYDGFNGGRDLTYSIGLDQNGLVSIRLDSTPAAPGIINAITNGATAMSLSIGRLLTATERQTIDAYAAKGAGIAIGNPTVAAGRSTVNDGDYRYGFDVGTAASQGRSQNGPGADGIAAQIGPFSPNGGPLPNHGVGSNMAITGFRAAQALQFGITKAGPPAVAAGTLMVAGLIGSGLTANQKAGVVTTAQNNPSVAAGANAAVVANTGFFHKIWVFFGFTK